MIVRRRRQREPVAFAILLLFSSCRGSAATHDATATPTVASSNIHTIAGRPFMLTVIEGASAGTAAPASSGNSGLCINCDGRSISFASSTGPASVAITGNRIQFGGHSFDVTAVPGTYVVDGTSHVLAPGGLHMFCDGKFVGTHSAYH